MKAFDYERATDPPAAVATVSGRAGAAFLGGGTNLVDHMRLGIAGPDLLVDVTGLPYDTVEETEAGGVRIGAAARNSDVAAHPLIRSRYPAVTRALVAGASGQLRNLATTGGNLMQRTRCTYFQDLTVPCNKRSPGSGCAAIGGYTRYSAILGTSAECIATHPSDFAVPLAAFDAVVMVLGAEGERRIPFTEFHRLPGDRPDRDTVLEHGELITAVGLPPLPIARRSTYRKVRDRASYAFALVSVAAALDVRGGVIADARVAFGGVAHKPWRARAAEGVLVGAPAGDETYRAAAAAELAAATPGTGNAFKVPMLSGALTAVLRSLAAAEPGGVDGAGPTDAGGSTEIVGRAR